MFVIRTYPRCGTHLVRTALHGHPVIKCENELINPDHLPNDAFYPGGVDAVVAPFREHPYTGFVVHAFTGPDHEAEVNKRSRLTWDWCKEHDDVKVIVLERRDLLRRAASVACAHVTGRWHKWRSQAGSDKPTPARLPPGKLEWEITSAERAFAKGRELFPDAAFFVYEDLVDNWSTEIARMQEFIGVTPVSLQPLVAKQNPFHISDMFANYVELRSHFTGTRFEKYFDYSETHEESRAV